MKKADYKESIFRYATPFVVGFIISIHSRLDEIMVALVTPRYYLALGISIAAAFGIMFIIRTVCRLLNKHHPLRSNFWKRILLQFLCGLGIPAVLELIIFELYFRAMGLDIFSSYFVYYDFPLVLAFMFIVNMFYFDYTGSKDKTQTEENDGDHIYIKRYGKVTKICISKEVLYVKRSPKGVHIFTKSGAKYSEYFALSTFLTEYGNKGLVQINRSVIINLAIIEGYQNGTRYGTLELIIKPEYKELKCMQDHNLFVVTAKEVNQFKEKFSGK